VTKLSIPGYEGLNQIGKGGFSRVYRGEQTKLKRTVAIKILNFGLNDEADRRSFERECELMGRVSTHPNIVTVHDTEFTTNGQPCIVMEHYPGGSLAELISEVRQLNPKEVLEVGVAIAAALEASHQAGVLHCDLKPQNILISEFGQPALGDFGISTFTEERTRTGSDASAGFTLAYAAPEIVEGASPSVQSDIYSLAATMYTSLAGRRPFHYLGPSGEKPTAAEQARRILLELPAPLTDVGVPTELDQLIRGAMAKDPAQRPESAAQYAHTLHEVGQRLGFSTSTPRIADQGALPVFEPAADFSEPGAPLAQLLKPPPASPAGSARAESNPFDSPDQRTELRANISQELAQSPTSFVSVTPQHPASSTADASPEPLPTAAAKPTVALDAPGAAQSGSPPETDAARAPAAKDKRRSYTSTLIGIGSLLIIAGVLLAVTRDSDDAATATTPAPTAQGPTPAVLLAPPAPSNVTVSRVGADSLLVTWSSPAATDVAFEVRRTDIDAETVQVERGPVILGGLDPNEAPCVEVIAVRGNRLTRSTDRPCASALDEWHLSASPNSCAELPCDVAISVGGDLPTNGVELFVTTLDGKPVDLDGVALSASTAQGEDTVTVSFRDDLEPGDYLVTGSDPLTDDINVELVIVAG